MKVDNFRKNRIPVNFYPRACYFVNLTTPLSKIIQEKNVLIADFFDDLQKFIRKLKSYKRHFTSKNVVHSPFSSNCHNKNFIQYSVENHKIRESILDRNLRLLA